MGYWQKNIIAIMHCWCYLCVLFWYGCLFGVLGYEFGSTPPFPGRPDYVEAKCFVDRPDGLPQPKPYGVVEFQQLRAGGPTLIHIQFTNFPEANKQYAIHIHEKAITNDDCMSAGAHYNPDNVDHAGPRDAIRHVGDLGNVNVNANFMAQLNISSDLVSLIGDRSVVGRSFVIHSGVDDLGKGGKPLSKTTGDAGGRLSCCTIQPAPYIHGVCIFDESTVLSDQPIKGKVELWEYEWSYPSKMYIDVDITGFNKDDNKLKHGFHVHDLTKDMPCKSAGSHFSRHFPSKHGPPTASSPDRHLGDLGNIEEDENGAVKTFLTDEWLKFNLQSLRLEGNAFVIDKDEDDFGSLSDNSNITMTALSCCVIKKPPIDEIVTRSDGSLVSSSAIQAIGMATAAKFQTLILLVQWLYLITS